LCNKICGASHYNMQMKIVVDTPQEFKAWLKDKPTLVSAVKAAAESEQAAENPSTVKDSTATTEDAKAVAVVEMK